MRKLLILNLVCLSLSAQAGQTISISQTQIKTLGIETTPLISQGNATSQRLPGEIVVPKIGRAHV